MKQTERSSYTADDFMVWREAGTLILTPQFQRREVWKNAARSFLMDTLLRGLPVPPIYLRVVHRRENSKAVREVVDGQQRLNALLGYIDGTYSLSRTLKGPWRGKAFAQLSTDEQESIKGYGFICEVLQGASDAEVLEIFARLNTYSVKLNAQELRNGRFFGLFKQTAYELAFEHVAFWRRHNIFSDQDIARMLEVELTSELLIAQIDGLQDKKKSVDQFYADLDDDFDDRDLRESQFRDIIDTINETFTEGLAQSAFRRPPLFYTLFVATFHRQFGLKGCELDTPKRRLTERERLQLRRAVDSLSDLLGARDEGDVVPFAQAKFIEASTSQTDNIGPRQTRLERLYTAAFGA